MATNLQQTRTLVNNPSKAKAWLVSKIRGISKSTLLNDRSRVTTNLEIGKLYFFVYNAKGKDDLPYWDKFPLVIPIESYHDGFLGINLHYLPNQMRAQLMDKLLDIANNKKMDGTTKLRITYSVLNGARKYRLFRPCVKKYLYNNLASKYILITADEWPEAILLPFHSFQNAPASEVWRDSRKQIY